MRYKLRILHIYKSFYPYTTGGIENFILQLSNEIKNYNVDNVLLTTHFSKEKGIYISKKGKLRVIYCPANLNLFSTTISFSLIKVFLRIYKYFDIIHFHFPWPFMDILTFFINKKDINNIKLITTYHSDIIKQKFLKILYKPMMNFFLKKQNCIIVTSTQYLNSSKDLKKFKKKCKVIPLGLSINHYPSITKKKIQSWKKILPSNFVLFIGVLRYYKGLYTLIEAAKYIDKKIYIVIAGNGPLEKKLKKRIKKLKLNNIIMLGYISEEDKVALIKLSKAIVLPSNNRTEAFGISLLEGAMFGKPLITCNLNTGTTFVVRHHFNGFVIQPNNYKELANVINKIVKDSNLNELMGKNSKLHFDEYFKMELIAKQYIKEVYLC